MQRLTDEVVLNFEIKSNAFAMWNMEINQIECSHKASIVIPDEKQGMFLNFSIVLATFLSLSYFQLPMGACNTFISQLVLLNHSTLDLITWVTLHMPFVSIGITTKMPSLSKISITPIATNFYYCTNLRLSEIEFEMDGNSGTGTADGFDGDCLDPTGAQANNKKDYIAIPFAEVIDSSTNPATLAHHSLFCLDSLDAKDVECKIFSQREMSV